MKFGIYNRVSKAWWKEYLSSPKILLRDNCGQLEDYVRKFSAHSLTKYDSYYEYPEDGGPPVSLRTNKDKVFINKNDDLSYDELLSLLNEKIEMIHTLRRHRDILIERLGESK